LIAVDRAYEAFGRGECSDAELLRRLDALEQARAEAS
jgi:hypothetical protein